LKYLRAITDGDKEILREMIELFIMQVPEYIANMHAYYQSGHFDLLGREAHKAKSSLDIVGMTELGKEMKILQLKILEGVDPDGCLVYIRHFETQCQKAIEELQAELALL
jgi:HPt (histidine-containing phosphotransfer) domain-containing protein